MFRVAENCGGVSPGQVFGKRKVLGWAFRARTNAAGSLWHVVTECACGDVALVRVSRLSKGGTGQCKSCSRTTHGGCYKKAPREQLYEVFHGIVARCGNPRHVAYDRYGGRGIRMCNEWRSDYAAFRKWALETGYKPGLSIDRIDNDGNYEPGNCRWATLIEQGRNKRNNVVLTAFGESKTVAEWCRDSRCSVADKTLRLRLKNGWDHQKAISKPSRNALSA